MQINPKSAHGQKKNRKWESGQIHLIDDVIIGRNECDASDGSRGRRGKRTTKSQLNKPEWKGSFRGTKVSTLGQSRKRLN